MTLLLIGVGVLLVDQVTKGLVMQTFPLHENVEVIPGFFNLTHIRNTGGAFGLLAGETFRLRAVLFFGMSFVALGIIFYLYTRIPSGQPWLDAALAMTFGGALGNLIDRLRFGEVIDFLDFHIGTLHWPAFNVADSAISVGVGIFCFYFLFKKI
ncbi:MAG: signal peptidase II [Deltaproteobacteria bacterium]|mgnify:CR=1 FL=1|nr:signal peptidase II [Deltaproteobacteria bacterium]MBW2020072.1 signal peptidase II [Deltaproteobacteria bacterium]MBW2074861.1 signal peptidase II [Deltaproteobacteria bacterium]